MDTKFGRSNNTADWHDNVQFDTLKLPTRLLVVASWGFHAQIVSKSRYLRYFMGNIRFSLVAKFLLTFLQQYEGDLVLKNAKKYNPDTKEFDAQDTIVLGQEKKFTYFIVSKQPSLEKGFNIAPFASVLHEEMDVVVLRDATADSLMTASISAFQGGAHVNSNDVEYYKTTELLLRVKQKAEICLDGEIHDLPAHGIIQLKTLASSTDTSSFTMFT
jgi:diacylglycerol kinase family enzyme